MSKKPSKSKPSTPASQNPSTPKEFAPIQSMADWLAGWLETSGMEEVEVEHKGLRLRLRKPGSGTYVQAAPAAVMPTAPVATAKSESLASTANTFNSPMVGTFYRSPGPDAASFVEVGDSVKAGQTLCIIEAMKTMNPIAAEKPGVVKKVLAQNAQPVEFGQPLFVIE
jgi:acetyl-CoA carboxylase biotin carboxyl carrier protein